MLVVQTALLPAGALFYLWVHRIRHRLRKVRYAKMLLSELVILHKSLESIKLNRYQWHGQHEPFTHSVYDGLVTSTNISYFGRDVQDALHQLYGLVEAINAYHASHAEPDSVVNLGRVGPGNVGFDNLEKLAEYLESTSSLVEDFLKQNTIGSWWRALQVVESADGD